MYRCDCQGISIGDEVADGRLRADSLMLTEVLSVFNALMAVI